MVHHLSSGVRGGGEGGVGKTCSVRPGPARDAVQPGAVERVSPPLRPVPPRPAPPRAVPGWAVADGVGSGTSSEGQCSHFCALIRVKSSFLPIFQAVHYWLAGGQKWQRSAPSATSACVLSTRLAIGHRDRRWVVPPRLAKSSHQPAVRLGDRRKACTARRRSSLQTIKPITMG